MKRMLQLIVFALLLHGTAMADGIMVSTDKTYPGDLLRNRVTRVDVTITGLVAETVVYQEFVNEWSRETNAVWAFPLPPDARATAVYYWRHDTLFQAVLRVQEQTTTPGTGEGGIPALINSYVGENGLKVELKGIEAWTVQRIELHYISVCDFSSGEGRYTYPLATRQLIQHPLDLVEFRMTLDAGTPVVDYVLDSGGDVTEELWEGENLILRSRDAKCFISSDITFQWMAESDTLAVDFFSSKSASDDGYFALLLRPPDLTEREDLLPKRVVFCVERSSRMYGYLLEQTKIAVIEAMKQLGEDDEFELVGFSSAVQPVFGMPVPATAENIAHAQAILEGYTAGGGTQLGQALETVFAILPDDSMQTMVITFTTGRSPADPDIVTALNHSAASLVMIGMGTDVDRSRLTMIAEGNAGFARYLESNAVMATEMTRILHSLVRPMLRAVSLEYPAADVYDVRPDPVPPLFAGMHTLTVGRYRSPGESSVTLFGQGAKGYREYRFPLDFAGEQGGIRSVAGLLWAKSMLDGMEREIDVHGVRPSLKDSLIALSLASGIRCRYTAYIADYKNIVAGMEDIVDANPAPSALSCILGNYPNPFNPQTSIRIRLTDHRAGAPLYLLIYDILGRLVRMIDISHLATGVHIVVFDGRDSHGAMLPTGTYTAVLSGQGIHSSRSLVLTK